MNIRESKRPQKDQDLTFAIRQAQASLHTAAADLETLAAIIAAGPVKVKTGRPPKQLAVHDIIDALKESVTITDAAATLSRANGSTVSRAYIRSRVPAARDLLKRVAS